jgi:outer membrane protein, multidrug efflux system
VNIGLNSGKTRRRKTFLGVAAVTVHALRREPAIEVIPVALFTGLAGLWTLSGSFTQPIFQGGRLKSNVRLAEAQQQQQAVLAYQQTIKGAFRDVSDALVAYRKNRQFRIQQEHLVESAQDAARLSEVRFKAGTTDYLEVLTNETNSFTAELGLAQAQGNELISLVQLYQALGGGWK